MNPRNECKFVHLRRPGFPDWRVPASRGGVTVAYKIDGDGIRWAHTVCSDKDNFSRRIGRNVASSRLRHAHNAAYQATFDGNPRQFKDFIIESMTAEGDYLCYSKHYQS